MYKITEEYKQYIENKTSLVPKCKIVVDGIEYTGKVIKTVPKISHSAEKMIGSFPIRTCSFDIYDMDNSLNFENKEIYVFKGLLVNNEIEYIPQGVFIAEADKITTDITKRTISFNNIQDRTIKFDTKYETKLDWSINHTGLEIIEEICKELEIPLETKEFNWYNYEFKQPNFLENCTYREVVSRMAEIGGGIAFISRTGGLVIKSQQTTDHFIYRKRYENLTRENEFGVINTVILGKDGIDDDIVYSSSTEGNKVEWKILDNPFVDLYREEMIERVAQYILGLNLTPFSLTGFVDGSYLDLNDTIEIIDKNNKIFKGVILNYENTSRIKSTIGANTQNTLATNYNLAGSQKQEMRNVKLQVDHNNNTIAGLVEEVEGQNEKISQLEIDIDGIRQEVSEITDLTIKGDTTEAKLNLDNVGEGYLFKLEVHPYFEDIAEIYPNQEIFPSDEMFLDDSKGDVHIAVTYPSSSIYPNYDTFTRTNPSMLKIENITTGDIVRYEIPTELYFLNENTYDILEYSYGKEKCTITKNVGFKNGIPYKLEEPIIEEYDFPLLETKNGNYLVELEDYSSGYIYCEMLGQTNYSEVFATKVELKSSITQTNEKIDLEVKNMQEYVDGSAETLESKITQTATDITSEVNSYKESTDGQIEELNSKITQSVESITQEVNKKVDETTVNSLIQQSADSITQQVNAQITDMNGEVQDVRGELKQYIKKNDKDEVVSAFNLNYNEVVIESDNFTLDADGNIDFNNGTAHNLEVSGGNIELTSQGQTARFTIKDSQDSGCKWSQSARTINWTGVGDGEISFSNTTSTPLLKMTDTSRNESININPNSISFSGSSAAITASSRFIETSNSNGWTIMKIVGTNIAMCWTTSVFTTDISTQSGNVYRTGEITMGLPSGLFSQLLVVNITDRAVNSLSWVCNRDQSDTTSLHYYIMCSTSSVSQSRRNDFFVIGTTY